MMTKNGIYSPSKLEDLEEAFEKYCPSKMFLDVGSGNGQVLRLAWENSASVRGVEIDKEFYETTAFKRWVSNTHFNKMDFSIYNIIYYFMKGVDCEDELAEKLNKEAREKIIIYRRGSNNKEVEEFISKLSNFKVTETFKYLYILSYI